MLQVTHTPTDIVISPVSAWNSHIKSSKGKFNNHFLIDSKLEAIFKRINKKQLIIHLWTDILYIWPSKHTQKCACHIVGHQAKKGLYIFLGSEI